MQNRVSKLVFSMQNRGTQQWRPGFISAAYGWHKRTLVFQVTYFQPQAWFGCSIDIYVTKCICTLCLCCCLKWFRDGGGFSRVHLHIMFVLLYYVCRSVNDFSCVYVIQSFTCVTCCDLDVTNRCSERAQEKASRNNNGPSRVPSNRKEEIKSGTSGCGSFDVPYFHPATSIIRLHLHKRFFVVRIWVPLGPVKSKKQLAHDIFDICLLIAFIYSTWCMVVWCTQNAPRWEQFHMAPAM